jgi:hypothetical protein
MENREWNRKHACWKGEKIGSGTGNDGPMGRQVMGHLSDEQTETLLEKSTGKANGKIAN